MSYLFDELKAKDKKAPIEDKILLMGLQQAGKTAIKDVVFFGKNPLDVENYMATIHYERQFIDEEKKSLIIDSGGQESYWNEAVTHFRHLVFSDVKLLLWIIDMTRTDLFEESERRFSFTIRQFKKENPKGMIAVLCHKVDLILPEDLVESLDYVKEIFDDSKFKIRFEASSIYYQESLKELIFTLMNEAKINTKRFELITNISEKVEESEEFQKYVIEHQDDPRIRQLMDYLNPEADRVLPTYGKTSIQFDLSAYNIIEIVLIDKNTFAPITGTSSKNVVNVEQTMDYIIALQEFKDAILNKPHTDDSDTISIVTSSNEKVHGLIVDLVSKYLLITSFSPITTEKTQAFYELIKKFASTIDPTQTIVQPMISSDLNTPIIEPQIIQPSPVDEKISIEPQKLTPIKEEPKVVPIIEQHQIQEKSVFSFINKLREEHASEINDEETFPEEYILEEQIYEESNVQEKDLIKLEIKDEITSPIESTTEQSPITPHVDDTLTPVEPKESDLEVAITQSIIKDAVETKAKPKSRFLQRLDEERKRYRVKQIAIQSLSADNIEKLEMTEEKIKEMAQFLTDAQTEEKNE